ncbi:MobC family replication-relaxation protein [Halomonas sp. AOP42-C2-23]|uniref:MobC family replication-relaxation protein n=1 Tax=unclassified Halomonas TaxID=2609666 RepID=UPI004034A91E
MSLISDPAARKRAAEEKRARLLAFLRDETWSTAPILQQVAGLQSRQAISTTLRQLERDQLVRRKPLTIAGLNNVVAWGITPHGLAMSWDDADDMEQRPVFEPSRLTLTRVPHQIDLQTARLAAEAAGWTDWQRGERQGKSEKGRITPDAVATRPDGVRVAIEIERTIKTQKRYQQIIAGHLNAIQSGDWKGVYYVCPDNLARRLQRLFDVIPYFLHQGERVPFEPQLRRRFQFMALDNFPPAAPAAGGDE